MNGFKERLGREMLFFDGAMGTQIQALGITYEGSPEDLNVTQPEAIYSIHKKYLDAGADIILANTFGANRVKYRGAYSVPEVARAAVEIAKKVVADSGRKAYVAVDIGATGKLLQPYGDLTFEDAYEAFAELIRAGAEAGADIISIETMMDIQETRIAILAAKENCSLPITATVSFEASGKTLTGASPAVVATVIGSLGVDAIGINCGLGPEQCIPIIEEMRKYTSVPLAVSPNAGLPIYVDGKTVYPLGAEEFADLMGVFADSGAAIMGGCCGTTPEHIRALTALYRERVPVLRNEKNVEYVASRAKVIPVNGEVIRIGERLNSCKNPEFAEALTDGDQFYAEDEAISQEEDGADILEICVSVTDTDEPSLMVDAIKSAQSMTALPVMIMANSLTALEKALRICNGRPAVKWIEECGLSLNFVRMLAKKYGACVVEQSVAEESEVSGIALGSLKEKI